MEYSYLDPKHLLKGGMESLKEKDKTQVHLHGIANISS
jgi:hypothetical protein